MACQTNQFFIICYFFYEIRWIGRVKRFVVLYTRRDIRALYLANPVYYTSVVLVQPVVVVVVILFRLQNTL
jgi:hypothetical protein